MNQLTPQNTAVNALSSIVKAGQEATNTAVLAPYTQQIAEKLPTAFIFLIDQSGSMSGKVQFNNNTQSKAEIVALLVNKMMGEIATKNTLNGSIKNRFDLCVIGYGQDSSQANIAWEGELAGQTWVKLSQIEAIKNIATQTMQVLNKEKKAININVKLLFSPKSISQTPMHSAFGKAKTLLQDWIATHPDSYPPTVINITDGECTDATDEQLLAITREVKTLATNHGNVLVFNCHLSSKDSSSVLFPREAAQVPDHKYARLLYDMSSEMPTNYNSAVAAERSDADVFENYTAMVYNGDINSLVKFLNIGTLPTK
jgi:hypothetical protein